MEYLEEENKRLIEELHSVNDELQSLREENMILKAQIKDPNIKIKMAN